MEKLTMSEIVQATGGELINGNGDDILLDISTDSRAVGENMLFVALIGDNFDGHDFAEGAIAHGAVGAVVSKDIPLSGAKILVEDTQKALGDIAKFYREKFNIPFIGITGSVGKTTTKDMIACVLESKFNVLKTKGNFNNQIGLPLTLLRISNNHEIAVTEMGMSGFGEIDALASMVCPETCVFTNIGMSHIEKLGSRENILKAKLEMLKRAKSGGNVVYCGDDDMLWGARNLFTGFNDLSYGISNPDCDVIAKDIVYGAEGTEFTVCHKANEFRVHIPVLGEHNVKNALAAYLVGLCYGVSVEEYKNSVSCFTPGNMRQNILHVNGIVVINDCYNASPSSVQAGLKILSQIDKNRRKIAVLGDMLEMGEWAEEAHTLVGKYVVENNVEMLVTVGKNSLKIADGAVEAGLPRENVHSFASNDEVVEFLDTIVKKGDIVLVKGSRGMKLETVVEHLVKF